MIPTSSQSLGGRRCRQQSLILVPLQTNLKSLLQVGCRGAGLEQRAARWACASCILFIYAILESDGPSLLSICMLHVEMSLAL